VATAAALASVLLLVASALAVLPGSPSKFESGNDPTLGVGNMIINTAGNTDWISVTGEANYAHITDVAASTGDDSFTPGQKQDTVCPDTENHKNPPKDDFTDVASFFEQNTTTGDVYLYGATIRYAANGNASENIELKKGTSGFCPGSTTLLARTPGDKLIAIDYLGGGSAVQFHVLTWVASGACFVANDPAPCWGANPQTLNPDVAEGGVSTSAFTAAQNPISGVSLVAGRFAEFGVNLTDAGILPSGSCGGFSQTIWESRSSGSSFVSSTKDITIEDKDIALCGSVSVRKVGSDGGSQEGAVFTLYEGSDTTGDVVGTCTVDASGDCLPAFTDLQPGTYTLDETGQPVNYGKDPNLPKTFTLAAGDELTFEFTDPLLTGAIKITKTSSKSGINLDAGFSITGPDSYSNSVSTGSDGVVCVDNLAFGSYTVTETTPPTGYAIDTPSGQTVVVDNTAKCSDVPYVGETKGFTDTPLADIQVRFRDGGSGETALVDPLSCTSSTGTDSSDDTTGWDDTLTRTGIKIGSTEVTITCTIKIDP
jgi:hypothetical protein